MTAIDFSKSVKTALAQRAAYICSNPECRCLTLRLVGDEASKVTYRGRAVAICGAEGGPRHDAAMNGNQRKAIDNAIFLCAKCAETTSRNRGAHYPATLLRHWKEQHKRWVRANLNLRAEEPGQLRLVRAAALRIDNTATASLPLKRGI
ncbi:hypothetical protein [Janthinobacterium sp. 17J80-10]|uniref:hypothetical protein n=1 Tax=Janthinobacterium sp. 17J80-10 TaxID=2497863 RepID=UPI0010059148|nr:hypothetical protein [Janthinobacterium sp. 17J80-10]QAU32856.1 hypothetical protein EKL02_00970 [Janthinobacterium sp. 17J80-10]